MLENKVAILRPEGAVASVNRLLATDSGNPDLSQGYEQGVQVHVYTPQYAYWARLLANGQILKKLGDQVIPVGELKADGRLSLEGNDGLHVFQDGVTGINVNIDALPQEQRESLQRVLLRMRRENSEIPFIREQLTSKGIDGRGVRVGVLEAEEFRDGAWHPHAHTVSVNSVINGAETGLAPVAATEFLGMDSHIKRYEKGPLILKLEDKPESLARCTVLAPAMKMDNLSERLESLLQQPPNERPRVINISWAPDRFGAYKANYITLNEKDAQGHYRYPLLRTYFWGEDPDCLSSIEKQQKMIDFSDVIIDKSSLIQNAINRYQRVVEQLAKQGTILVVGAGNNHVKYPDSVKLRPGSEMSFLARSPFVITVGASDSQLTPGYYQDDTIWSGSSQGDGKGCNPTLVAPGYNITLSSSTTGLLDMGTSFATPYVSGTIAMMLQVNPDLSFEEVKEILTRSATRLGVGTCREGAGVVNAPLAVKLAQEKRWPTGGV